jgi:hypothetical protein
MRALAPEGIRRFVVANICAAAGGANVGNRPYHPSKMTPAAIVNTVSGAPTLK